MEVKIKSQNEKVVFIDKKEINEPLSTQSKYLVHLADNDPDQPGNNSFLLNIYNFKFVNKHIDIIISYIIII